MDINSLTANRIKELRLEVGKPQAEIAQSLGISPSAYERLENGKIDINIKTLERIATYYNISVPELITQKNSNNYHYENQSALNIQGPNSTFQLYLTKEDLDKADELLTKIKTVKKAKK